MVSINLDNIRSEEDALEQSVVLNKIVIDMMESNKAKDKRMINCMTMILVLSIFANLLIATLFLYKDSKTSLTTETSTVTEEVEEIKQTTNDNSSVNNI